MITLLIFLVLIVLLICVGLVLTVGGIFIIPALIDIVFLWLLFHKKKKKGE